MYAFLSLALLWLLDTCYGRNFGLLSPGCKLPGNRTEDWISVSYTHAHTKSHLANEPSKSVPEHSRWKRKEESEVEREIGIKGFMVLFDRHMGPFPLRKGHLTLLFINIESDLLKAFCFPVTYFANMKCAT